ncbi:MAG: putative toxin-antitoxin system toxin component, PIN family [Deltaproteobacteria bacterium]|nr:putative toxin-antitoxin system toxin component, PIN family [Deltaproteobacteria bacterium]
MVIDTNIVISALNFGGNPKAVLELARKNRIHNTTTPFIINEVEKVLTQKFGWQMEVTREVLNDFRGFSHVVNPSETIAVISYAPDNRILECAVAGRADCIISGDHHLTDLKTYFLNNDTPARVAA